jgi:hypothetical protein
MNLRLLLPLFLCLTTAHLPAQLVVGPKESEVAEAMDLAIAHLLKSQESYDVRRDPLANRRRRGDGEAETHPMEAGAEWPYEGVYRSQGPQGLMPIPPGYRVGGTAICCLAILEAPGFGKDPARGEAFQKGLTFVMDFMEGNPEMDATFVEGYDVRGWGHTYALTLALRALAQNGLLDEATATRLKRTTRWLISTLEKSEIGGRGGWNYARRSRGKEPAQASTFMTAPTVLALLQAKSQGFEVDDGVLNRAVASLEAARLPDLGTFQYGTGPGKGSARTSWEHPAGSSGRSAVCELALHVAGKGSEERLRAAIMQFMVYWDELKARHQGTGTHIPEHYMIAPYYFYFAHTYTALAIEQLPKEERGRLRQSFRELLFRTREKDGTWNDRVFPRSSSFGSAMSVLALCAPRIEGWFPKRP